MKLKVIAVFDSAAQAFTRPVFFNTTGQALRGFTDEVNNRDSELGKHPEDYSLYQLSEFDDTFGTFEGVPTILCRGKDAVLSRE